MGANAKELSKFQKDKYTHLFRIFYDANHDDVITLSDFNQIIQEIKKYRQWSEEDPRMKRIEVASQKVFARIMSQVDEDKDEKVTITEWLAYWSRFCEDAGSSGAGGEWPVMGLWQQEYAKAMFEFLDTNGDSVIDRDEYVAVISQYGSETEDARECYERLTTDFDEEGNWSEKELGLARYLKLYLEFLTSDDPKQPGNYLWGKVKGHHAT